MKLKQNWNKSFKNVSKLFWNSFVSVLFQFHFNCADSFRIGKSSQLTRRGAGGRMWFDFGWGRRNSPQTNDETRHGNWNILCNRTLWKPQNRPLPPGLMSLIYHFHAKQHTAILHIEIVTFFSCWGGTWPYLKKSSKATFSRSASAATDWQKDSTWKRGAVAI